MKLLRMIISASMVYSAMILAPLFGAYAEEDTDFNPYMTFKFACRLYAESRFEDAVKEYEGILNHGYESGNLYYDLGNAYFKTGSLGKAILNYERAKRLLPHDSDLRANLEYARSFEEEPPMDKAYIWLSRRLNGILDYFTIDTLTKSLSVIYLGIVLLLCLLLVRKDMHRLIFRAMAVLMLVFMMDITLLSVNIYRIEYRKSAIVVAQELNARFEPRDDATVHFKLYAGSGISIIKKMGDWSQVKREDGKVGWVESSSYEII